MNPLVGVSVPSYEAWNIQYATVTDKSPKDFSPIPGWRSRGRARPTARRGPTRCAPNQKWSDGQPLTAEDVAYTINRAKKEEWLNYTSVVANLTAKATDDRTLVVTLVGRRSQAPDAGHATSCPSTSGRSRTPRRSRSTPRSTASARGRSRSSISRRASSRASRPTRTTTAASRPSTASSCATSTTPTRWSPRSSAARSTPPRTCPGTAFHQLEKDPNIVTVQGNQGAMNEFAINGGAGLKKPHPALARPARAPGDRPRDRQEDDRQPRARRPRARPADTLSVSPDADWSPEIPADQHYDFNLDKANQILDAAGYKDTNGDGIREMPGGGRPLKFRYAVRSEGDAGPPTAELITRLAAQDRDRDHAEGLRRQPAHRGHRQGRLRPLRLGLDAVRRPRPDALVLHLRPGQQGPQGPDELLQRRELVRPAVRRALQAAEGRARQGQAHGHRPPDAHALLRVGRLRRALHVPRPAGLSQGPLHRLDPPAREDRAGAVLQQLADLRDARSRWSAPAPASGGGDGGGGSGGLIAIIVIAVVVLGAGGLWPMRRRTADERE